MHSRVNRQLCLPTLVAALWLPTSIHAQTYSRTEVIEYHDDPASWVLGQRKKLTVEGMVSTLSRKLGRSSWSFSARHKIKQGMVAIDTKVKVISSFDNGKVRLVSALRCLSAVFVVVLLSGRVSAQGGIQPYIEYRKHTETAQNISPLDNGLFGEQVSLYNGSTNFSVTDIEAPGNGALPVRLMRRFSVEVQPQDYSIPAYDSLLRGIGNWDIDVPYMAATYAASTSNAMRCNGLYAPSGGLFRRSEIWQGISVNIPGRGSTFALGMQAATPRPPDSVTYRLTTSERDLFDCIPMQAGFTGEGFRMTTTSGMRYYFDVAASRAAAQLVKHVKDSNGLPLPIYLNRTRLYLLASKIEDRLGNIVQFQYNANGHPTRIWSSDGREINLTYSNGRLTMATSHGRTWQYQYTNVGSGLYARLAQVVQPDSSKWQYTYSDDLMPGPDERLPPLPWCTGASLMLAIELTLTATHPSGAVGVFSFNNRRHYRSGVHATECQQAGDPANPHYDLLVPHYFDVMSIDSKIISGPGQPTMTWSYTYDVKPQMSLWGSRTAPPVYPCTTCTTEKTVTVTNPDATKSRYTFGMRYYDNDGRQLKVESLDAAGVVVRTETSTYLAEAAASNQPFHGEYGTILGYISDPASAKIRPIINRTVTQDGANFIWQVDATCGSNGTALCFDQSARPTKITKSSAPLP